MTKGYKLDTSDYEVTSRTFGDDGEVGEVTTNVQVRYILPQLLCNPGIGQGQNTDPNFDILAIGVVAKKIEQSEGKPILLDKDEKDALEKRAKYLAKYVNYSHYDMLARCVALEETELTEKGSK